MFGARSLRCGVIDILGSLYVNLWRHFEHIKKSIVIIHQTSLTLNPPPPPSIPTHNTWSVGPTAFSQCESLSTSYQEEPFTYYTVVPVPSLVKSNSPRLLWWHWIPLGCEFRCPLSSPLVSSRLIWCENSLPCFSLCGVPWPGLRFTLFLLRQCLSFLPFSPCAKSSLPLAQALSGCALGAMHWSFWNFLYVMLHQIGAVNESGGATFLLWSPSNELQL